MNEEENKNSVPVYNETKTEELTEYDLTKGELKEDVLLVHHDAVEGQEEEGHYETIAEYPNGGKDVKWIVDKPFIEAKEAEDEQIRIKVYKPFDEKILALNAIMKQIDEIKKILSDTDYKAIKYAEGWYTEEEYAATLMYRQSLRDKIHELEKEFANIQNSDKES